VQTGELEAAHLSFSVVASVEELAQKAFCCLPVAPALHEDIEHMAVLIDCAPQVVMLALDD